MIVLAAAASAAVGAGWAEETGGRLDALTRLEFAAAPELLGRGTVRHDAWLEDAAPPEAPRFGAKGSWRWNMTGGAAVDTDESQNRFYQAGGGLSFFVIENFSLEMEFNGLYFDQIDENAFALNFNFLARWHLLADDEGLWSFFIDGGGGCLLATDTVPGPEPADPRGGNHFEFTPQAGVGYTVDLDGRARLVAGVRWHHISNARIRENNPPRDSAYVYGGVSFPF